MHLCRKDGHTQDIEFLSVTDFNTRDLLEQFYERVMPQSTILYYRIYSIFHSLYSA